jgi:hypothetical protein
MQDDVLQRNQSWGNFRCARNVFSIKLDIAFMLHGKDPYPISCMALGAQLASSLVAGTTFKGFFLVANDGEGGVVGRMYRH